MTLTRLIILAAVLLLFTALSLIGGSLALNTRTAIQSHADQYDQRLSQY